MRIGGERTRVQRRAAGHALELAWSMGRPVIQAPGEIRTCVERATFMIAAAITNPATAVATANPHGRRGATGCTTSSGSSPG